MTTAADATLSRNHNGDVLLIQPGKPNMIVANVGSPLWFAIVNAAPATLQPVGVTTCAGSCCDCGKGCTSSNPGQ